MLVVLYHAARWLDRAGPDTDGWQQVNATLASLRMPLFFTMAGMFAYSWIWKRTWREVTRVKLLLYAWVFIIWECIGTAFFWWGTGIGKPRIGIRDALTGLAKSLIQPSLEAGSSGRWRCAS